MEQRTPEKSVEELIREQGGRPRRFEELLGPPGGDEEKENVDEFLAMLRDLDGPSRVSFVNEGETLVPAK